MRDADQRDRLMEKVVVDQLAQRIFALLGEQIGPRGKTLEARFRKLGRLVPKRARDPIRTLIEAQKMAENPNLAMRVDPDAVSVAYDQALDALKQLDAAAEKSRKRFNLAALISLQVILVTVVFVAVMRWRGFL